jgi:hypothetical protein
MSKSAKPAEPERQQWVLDPHSPTGLRLVDLPAPSSPPGVPLTLSDWQQKQPPDRAPPTEISHLAGRPDPFSLKYELHNLFYVGREPRLVPVEAPPFTRFSLKGADGITRYELLLHIVGSEPYAPWWRQTNETPAGRMSLINSHAPEAERNLDRDIRDGKTCPLVLGYDTKFGQLDHSSDVFDLEEARGFVCRMRLCPEGRDRGYGERFLQLLTEREAHVAAGYAASGANPSRRRGAYAGPLQEWMAGKSLSRLRRTGPGAIAEAFKYCCEQERPELLALFPKRLRSMESLIERIITRRVDEAKRANTKPPTASKSQ